MIAHPGRVIVAENGSRLTVEPTTDGDSTVQLWAHVPAVLARATACASCRDPEQAGVSLDATAAEALIDELRAVLGPT